MGVPVVAGRGHAEMTRPWWRGAADQVVCFDRSMASRDRRSQVANLIFDFLGILFLLATLGAIYVVLFLIWNFGDPDVAFPFGAYEIRAENSRFLKVSGIILFGLFALVGWGAANLLLDRPIARFRRWRRLRREE